MYPSTDHATTSTIRDTKETTAAASQKSKADSRRKEDVVQKQSWINYYVAGAANRGVAVAVNKEQGRVVDIQTTQC